MLKAKLHLILQRKKTDLNQPITYKVGGQIDQGQLKTFDWMYEGQNYQMEVLLNEQTYNHFKELSRPKFLTSRYEYENGTNGNYSVSDYLVNDYGVMIGSDESNKAVKPLYEQLVSFGKAQGFNEDQILKFIIAFVQGSIKYENDNVTTGYDDYSNFPYETLYTGIGDCEDTSILLGALLEFTQHETVVYELNFLDNMKKGHVLLGIDYNPNKKFDWLETTRYHPIGILPESYDGENGPIITKDNYLKYVHPIINKPTSFLTKAECKTANAEFEKYKSEKEEHRKKVKEYRSDVLEYMGSGKSVGHLESMNERFKKIEEEGKKLKAILQKMVPEIKECGYENNGAYYFYDIATEPSAL